MARVIFKRQNPGAAEDGSVEVIAGARFIFKRRNPGAAEDGKVKVLIVARAIFQRRNQRPTHACRPPRCPWATREGRAREGRGAGRGGGRAAGRGTWRRTWPSGPGRRAPSSPRHHHRRRRRLCAARAEIGAHLGSSVALGSGGSGQALPGVPRKAPLQGASGRISRLVSGARGLDRWHRAVGRRVR